MRRTLNVPMEVVKLAVLDMVILLSVGSPPSLSGFPSGLDDDRRPEDENALQAFQSGPRHAEAARAHRPPDRGGVVRPVDGELVAAVPAGRGAGLDAGDPERERSKSPPGIEGHSIG